jgi:hypothetical protein
MAIRKSNVDLVIRILDQLEGHPNFVKANRIIDELLQAKLISIDEQRNRKLFKPSLTPSEPRPPLNRSALTIRCETEHP